MQGTTIPTQIDLAEQLTERFGLLLTQGQLAELLGRSTGGLRYKPVCAARRPHPGAQGLQAPDRPTRLLPRHRGRPRHQRRGRRVTQTIRRAARRHRFVIVDQAAVEDTRLSWAARGMLAYLLSRPDDWKVLVNDLKKRGNLGRDGIYALLRELRSSGYVRFERNRDARGRMRGGTYIVSEVPAPCPDAPDADKPATAAPRPVRPGALPNTDGYQRSTTTNRPTDRQTPTAAREPIGARSHCAFPNGRHRRCAHPRSASLPDWIAPPPNSSSMGGRARWPLARSSDRHWAT